MKKILRLVADLSMYLSIMCLASMVFLGGFEITLRYFFGQSLFWIQDITLLLMMWFLFMGIIKLTYEKIDVYVDIFVNILPTFWHRVIDIIVSVLCVVFSIILLFASCDFFKLRIGRNTVVAGIPTVFYTSAIIVCCLILIMIFVYRIYELLFRFQESQEEEN